MKNFALLLAAGTVAVSAVPAQAVEFHAAPAPVVATYGTAASPDADTSSYDRRWDDRRHRDDRRWRDDRGRRDDRRWDDRRYDDRRADSYWRGNDGRLRCRRADGTTGLVIGAVGGALAGRAVDTRGDRTVGTLLGAIGGGLLGREIDRGGSRCR